MEVNDEIIDKYKVRNLKYYSDSTTSSENDATRKEMEKYVLNLIENNSIETIASDKRQQDIKQIADEYAKLTSSDDSNFTYLNKFTTCGTKRCSKEDGKRYLESKISSYYETEIVTKNNTDILYEAARNVLFSDSVENYLYKIGDQTTGYKYYLISPLYITDKEHAINDIILFNNESGNLKYYLVEVDVITSESKDPIKSLAAEALVDKVSASAVMDYYFGKSEIEIHDKDIRDVFISAYGDYSAE
jgi:hypothetical protein